MNVEYCFTLVIVSTLSGIVNGVEASTVDGITLINPDKNYVFDEEVQQREQIKLAHWRPTGSTGVA